MDQGGWWAIVHRLAKIQTQLRDYHTHTLTHTHTHAIGILARNFCLTALCINSGLEKDQVKCGVQWDAIISDKTVPCKLKP